MEGHRRGRDGHRTVIISHINVQTHVASRWNEKFRVVTILRFQLGLVAPLASTYRSGIWIVVVVALVIVKISVMIKFGVGVVHKIVRSSGVLFSVVTNVTLNDIVDVARTVLIKFQVMTRTFLKDNDGDIDRAEDAELIGLFEETILTL